MDNNKKEKEKYRYAERGGERGHIFYSIGFLVRGLKACEKEIKREKKTGGRAEQERTTYFREKGRIGLLSFSHSRLIVAKQCTQWMAVPTR